MACHVQAGSAASLEWIVVGLTTGPIRGSLKPTLECVIFGNTLGTLAVGVVTGSFGVGSGLERGSTMGLLGRDCALVAGMDVG